MNWKRQIFSPAHLFISGEGADNRSGCCKDQHPVGHQTTDVIWEAVTWAKATPLRIITSQYDTESRDYTGVSQPLRRSTMQLQLTLFIFENYFPTKRDTAHEVATHSKQLRDPPVEKHRHRMDRIP